MGGLGSWILPVMRLGQRHNSMNYTPSPREPDELLPPTQSLGHDPCVEREISPSVLVLICQALLCLAHHKALGRDR